MERGDVAVTDEHLGIASNHAIIQQRQQPRRAVTPAHADDPVHTAAGKHLHHSPRPLATAARQKPPALADIWREPRLEPKRFDHFDGAINGFWIRRSARRSYYSERVSGFEARRL